MRAICHHAGKYVQAVSHTSQRIALSGLAQAIDDLHPGRPQGRDEAADKAHEESEGQRLDGDSGSEFELESEFAEGLEVGR